MAADAEERAGVVGSQEDDVENERLLSNSGETSSFVEAFEVEGRGRGSGSSSSSSSYAKVPKYLRCFSFSSTMASFRSLRRIFSSHPKLLWVLASTEVWERFSYYGMRAMLVLYLNNVLLRPEVMTKVLGLPSLAAVYGQKEILLSTGEEVGEEIRTKAVQAFASEVYGTYTSLVYLTPIAGGLLADQIFGQHAMIIAGSIIMAIGHGLLSAHETFVFGLLCIIVGNGCFKPNISARVGKLYDKNQNKERERPSLSEKETKQKHLELGDISGEEEETEERDAKGHHQQKHNSRDEAFSIFYCAINFGAFLAPLVVGTIRTSFGYGAAFSAAGFGMVIGLVIYLVGTRMISNNEDKDGSKYDMLPVSTTASQAKHVKSSSEGDHSMMMDSGADWGDSTTLLSPTGDNSGMRSRMSSSTSEELQEVDLNEQQTCHGSKGDHHLLYSSASGKAKGKADGPFVSHDKDALRDPMKFSWDDFPRVVALLAVCLMAVCFWAVFEQQGNTLAQFADHSVNRRVTLGGHLLFEIPTEYIQSINPIFILILTPLVNTLWRKQSKIGSEPKPLTKMSIGCFLLALGYAVLALAELVLSDPISGEEGKESKISIVWIVISLGLATLGELYLSPVGLSFVSAVAPPYMTSLAVGCWMLASFGGNFLAGHLGAMYPYMSHASYFIVLTLMALANSLVLLMMSRPLSKKLEL